MRIIVASWSRHGPSQWGGQGIRTVARSGHHIHSEETDSDERWVPLSSLSPFHTVQGAPQKTMPPTVADSSDLS